MTDLIKENNICVIGKTKCEEGLLCCEDVCSKPDTKRCKKQET